MTPFRTEPRRIPQSDSRSNCCHSSLSLSIIFNRSDIYIFSARLRLWCWKAWPVTQWRGPGRIKERGQNYHFCVCRVDQQLAQGTVIFKKKPTLYVDDEKGHLQGTLIVVVSPFYAMQDRVKGHKSFHYLITLTGQLCTSASTIKPFSATRHQNDRNGTKLKIESTEWDSFAVRFIFQSPVCWFHRLFRAALPSNSKKSHLFTICVFVGFRMVVDGSRTPFVASSDEARVEHPK